MSKRGRKKSVNINKREVRNQVKIFGKLLATHEEMADYFDCSVRTIERYMQTADEENITDFCRVYKKAASVSKTSLRRKQMQKAQAGDNSMLIWLGKQLLNQKDKSDVMNNGDFTIVVNKQIVE
jgi:regulator of sigma D